MRPNYVDTLLLIDGRWREGRGGKRIAVRNPGTGETIGHVAHADTLDLDDALQAAWRGFAIWRATSVHERQAVLRRAAGLLKERVESIAPLLTLEQGKPLREARAEILAGVAVMEWFADEALRLYGRIVPAREGKVVQQVIVEPVGPVAAFTPWNFPMNQIIRKLAAALACGCSFLCKAPEETPASPAALFQVFMDAGIPDGVLGLVYGDPSQISSHLIASPMIRKVTFTGSTAVGKHLAALAGHHMKRCTMELGGHAPVIVADDADVELAIQSAGASKVRNAGQVCISPTRFLVHRDVKDAFTEGMLRRLQEVDVGDGMDENVGMGPLANERRVTAMQQLVDDAAAKGAVVLTGGERMSGNGNFYPLTMLDNVPLNAEVMSSEPFGPLLALRTFDGLDEAIAEANRLPYGLAAYAFTSSLRTMHRLSREIEAGMVWINQPALALAEMPFGGVKESGYGSEGGPEALAAYSIAKAVSVAMV